MTNSKNVFNVVLVLGLIVLVVVLINYNNKKSPKDNMYSPDISKNAISTGNSLSLDSNVAPVSDDMNYLNVSGLGTNNAGSCNQPSVSPSDLLPKDMNSDWSNVNPANADLKNINLLSAGQLIGINTIGSSLRNANLQERSEPVIPKSAIGPWNQSTIDGDTLRRPLEIGSGAV
jgi:uncharacterized protein YjbI with pentapeptide repeats